MKTASYSFATTVLGQDSRRHKMTLPKDDCRVIRPQKGTVADPCGAICSEHGDLLLRELPQPACVVNTRPPADQLDQAGPLRVPFRENSNRETQVLISSGRVQEQG